MSILIKGIDMPKEGEHILALIKNDGKCSYFEETALTRIMKTTEAIQIPTPHGRLIDGGKLYKDFENYCSGECDCCVHETENYTCGLIAEQPTILETEE